jgi:hypothetical protein
LKIGSNSFSEITNFILYKSSLKPFDVLMLDFKRRSLGLNENNPSSNKIKQMKEIFKNKDK